MGKKTSTAPRSEAKGLAFLGLSILLGIAFLTFQQGVPQKNWLGLIGYATAWMLSYLFGLISFAVIGFFGWAGFRLLACRPIEKVRVFYFSLFLFSTAILLNLLSELGAPVPEFLINKVYLETTTFDFPYAHRYDRYNLGGVPLYFFYRDFSLFNLQRLLSDIGIAITFSIIAIVSFALMANVRLFPFIEKLLGKLQALKERSFHGNALETMDQGAESDAREIDILPPPSHLYAASADQRKTNHAKGAPFF